MSSKNSLAIALVAIFLFIGTLSFLYLRQDILQGEDGNSLLRELRESILRDERAQYESALADVQGGKTPEETLALYAAAVSRGDFSSASSYLVAAKQEEERHELVRLSEKNNLSQYVTILSTLRPYGEVSDSTFTMRATTTEGAYYYIRFIRYPNSIWKIMDS
jgi:hypothetical protein